MTRTAGEIYRSDVIEAAVTRLPTWRVRLLHLAYGLGLWSGDLDSDLPEWISAVHAQRVRDFAQRWLAAEMRPIVCDAARSVASRDVR